MLTDHPDQRHDHAPAPPSTGGGSTSRRIASSATIAGDHQQRDAVAGGRQDLGPFPAERPAPRSPGGPPAGSPTATPPIAPTSDSMCPASDSSASDPEISATMTSAIMNAASSASAISRYRRSAPVLIPWPCPPWAATS